MEMLGSIIVQGQTIGQARHKEDIRKAGQFVFF